MAQTGGTWDPKVVKAGGERTYVTSQFKLPSWEREYKDSRKQGEKSTATENTALATTARSRSTPSSPPKDAENGEEQDWAVIERPEERRATEMCARTNVKVGWGDWKLSLFKWNVNVTKEQIHDDGEEEQEQTQKWNQDSNGVKVTDDVHFVTVRCPP